jgi:hypothetical protein
MANFYDYYSEQVYLSPPGARDVLGAQGLGFLCLVR